MTGGSFRGKTSTSSQRTLRYNDFELVQKQAEKDPAFAVHLDEDDNKHSPKMSEKGHGNADKESVKYPDIKM